MKTMKTITKSTYSRIFTFLAVLAFWAANSFAAVVTVTYTTGSEVAVTSAGYAATGNTVNFTLNYAPVPGTQLMVVKNTGLSFISGTFSNLTQGQTVALAYNGETYNFVANYYGGTGNDLVLVWKDARAFAWGGSYRGQLGNNSTTDSHVPVAVTTSGVLGDKTVFSVAAGSSHSLALCSDGTVAAWGENLLGQLGNNSTTSSAVPVAVDRTGVLAGKTVVAVSAGRIHNLALCSDGTVAAWGSGSSGTLGNNFAGGYSTVPVAVDRTGVLAGKTVVAVSAGNYHSLALCSDGTVAAWGSNIYGFLGNNSTTSSAVPVAVDRTGVLAGKTVVAISAGDVHSVALCSDGTVATWGANYWAQLGNNSLTASLVPVAVTTSGVLTGKTVVAVAAGQFHNVALCSDSTVATWGANDQGQLGNNSGATSYSAVPVAVDRSGVLSGKAVVAVAASSRHTVALCSDGTVAAWGGNDYGQLGNNSTTQSNVPVAVTSSPLAAGERFSGLYRGSESNHCLALVANFTLSPAQAFNSAMTSAGLTGPNALTTAAPYNDGVKNLLKYAFNMNLSGPDSRGLLPGTGTSGLPSITSTISGGITTLRVEFIRRRGSGLVYTPKRSHDLSSLSWVAISGVPTVTPIDANWERVVYQMYLTTATNPKGFGVVEVTLP